MTIYINKETALQDFINKHVQDRWQNEFIAIDKNYCKNKDSIDEGLIAAFDTACKKALNLQKQGLKDNIQYIYFSFLRTRIMENTAFYRIDLYDKQWFLDPIECFALWDANFIFNSLFQHVDELKEVIKSSTPARNITPMDIDRIKLSEAIKYHMLALEFIRSMLPSFLENIGYTQMGKTLDICIMAGEYLDASEVIYPENRDT